MPCAPAAIRCTAGRRVWRRFDRRRPTEAPRRLAARRNCFKSVAPRRFAPATDGSGPRAMRLQRNTVSDAPPRHEPIRRLVSASGGGGDGPRDSKATLSWLLPVAAGTHRSTPGDDPLGREAVAEARDMTRTNPRARRPRREAVHATRERRAVTRSSGCSRRSRSVRPDTSWCAG